ncbi:hypothetical protein [Alkalitalea saponilacus]|uniref:Uncharacterized protein n=1 Tax=Alkalitalea saponilacus TaxID=889453 RepID=A0A1T5E8P0_9BACT|nr:hypothetical protein [Alkalitalea saponilacus]ASB49078.1 hypothetical protein CDL62_07970 [Alkalitalea saponilacus]SKB80251.1 hypothetical protein SAMN03080601_01237 [Alkalitalea saponilacus]
MKILKRCFNISIVIICIIGFNQIPIFSQEEITRPNTFVSVCTDTITLFDTAYISHDEHSLVLKPDSGIIETAYRDTSSVLQLIEISPDNKWAIIISMPAEIDDGRMETTYQLIDLCNRKMVNDELKTVVKDFVPGNDMFFLSESTRIYLIYYSSYFDYYGIELISERGQTVP